MSNPQNIIFVYSLTKIQEECVGATKQFRRVLVARGVNSHSSLLQTPIITTLLVKKINQTQMKDRQGNDLCYYCESN